MNSFTTIRRTYASGRSSRLIRDHLAWTRTSTSWTTSSACARSPASTAANRSIAGSRRAANSSKVMVSPAVRGSPFPRRTRQPDLLRPASTYSVGRYDSLGKQAAGERLARDHVPGLADAQFWSRGGDIGVLAAGQGADDLEVGAGLAASVAGGGGVGAGVERALACSHGGSHRVTDGSGGEVGVGGDVAEAHAERGSLAPLGAGVTAPAASPVSDASPEASTYAPAVNLSR